MHRYAQFCINSTYYCSLLRRFKEMMRVNSYNTCAHHHTKSTKHHNARAYTTLVTFFTHLSLSELIKGNIGVYLKHIFLINGNEIYFYIYLIIFCIIMCLCVFKLYTLTNNICWLAILNTSDKICFFLILYGILLTFLSTFTDLKLMLVYIILLWLHYY